MISFQNSIEISRSIEDVHLYLADLENVPEWNYAIERTVKITPGPTRTGTEYLQIRSLPRPIEERIRITGLEAPHLLEVTGTLGPFGARLAYELTPTETGTKLVNQVHLTAACPARIMARLATSSIKKAVASNLDVLKEIMEQ